MGAADLLLYIQSAGFTLDVSEDKLLVTPASLLTDELRVALRACKPELIELLRRPALANDHGAVVGRTCAGCTHRLPRGTCAEPVAAGLLTEAEGFCIVWPPEGYGGTCAAFDGKALDQGTHRPYRLTKAEGDACHAPAWDDEEIARFSDRVQCFASLAICAEDADDLAERLTLRDRQHDDRRICLECSWLSDTGRCVAAATGRIPGADRWLEPVPTILQRCGAFGLRKGLV